MDRESIQKTLFALLRFEICGTELSDGDKNLSPESLSALYKLSKAHDLAHLVADALDKNGLLDLNDDTAKKFSRERQMAVYRYEQINYELEELCQALETAEIEHIPLKGSVIRRLYPEPWMRTSCDIDILVREEQVETVVKLLVENLHYEYGERDEHDVSLYSAGGVHLELHFKLSDVRITQKGENVLAGVWALSAPREGWSYRKEMSDGMFYFFHLAHMAKHFYEGGCGVRPFIDLWILNHKTPYERSEREKLLKEGSLSKFESGARALSEVWFSGAEQDERTRNMQDYILCGGVYGTMENGVVVKQARRGGKFKYILSRIFVPYKVLVIRYPSLKKHKWLFPFYQVRRWGRLLLKGKAKKSMRELNAGLNVSEEAKVSMEKLLHDLGL